VQRQVGHRHGLEQAFDHIPFADRAELVDQRAGREQCGGSALVIGGGQVDGIARQFQVGAAAAEHAGERLRIAGLDGARMAVPSADHGLLVDAHLLGQPPLLKPEFGHALAQPGAVQDEGEFAHAELDHRTTDAGFVIARVGIAATPAHRPRPSLATLHRVAPSLTRRRDFGIIAPETKLHRRAGSRLFHPCHSISFSSAAPAT